MVSWYDGERQEAMCPAVDCTDDAKCRPRSFLASCLWKIVKNGLQETVKYVQKKNRRMEKKEELGQLSMVS